MLNPDLAAAVFLLLVAVGVVLWIGRALLRPPLPPLQNGLMLLDRLLTVVLWRTIYEPFPHLPDRGVVVVCNHRSSVDPFFVQRATWRGIYWMVAREFVEHPAFRRFLTACDVIPVSRGGNDTAATRMAIRRLSNRQIVGMFPEGRINMTEQVLLPGRPGAAVVAMKTESVLVPCFILGAPYRRVAWSPFFMPTTVSVRFGAPIDAVPYAQRVLAGESEIAVANELIVRVMTDMARLAGHPEFTPELAGRNWKPTAAQIEADANAAEARLRGKAGSSSDGAGI